MNKRASEEMLVLRPHYTGGIRTRLKSQSL